MQCKKCGDSYPRTILVDGKQIDCRNRKYCFKCSPFGQRNNRKLELCGKPKNCLICNKTMFRKNEKGKYCWVCTNKKNREDKLKKLQEYTGDSCWFCNYNRCWAALEFHHVYPESKLFGLTKREMQFTWGRIFEEAQKCVLACSCCHREIHENLISLEEVERIWKEKWGRKLNGRAECS